MFTYYSQNYAGIIGAGLPIIDLSQPLYKIKTDIYSYFLTISWLNLISSYITFPLSFSLYVPAAPSLLLHAITDFMFLVDYKL